ncbi:Protein of unknown function [Pseudomonas linyingensis]|uniref:DUF1329 domain-containing protein n=1 Tax=Pseudomonas linyingensis TaxID=915471 RepID=A0A1H6YLV0_9PSED|nr:DUF1329 domain-containing protein [Pseudomonas linyingensis]SEJ42303.1 Protein of unknown function [Pseudomonas linyingensis]
MYRNAGLWVALTSALVGMHAAHAAVSVEEAAKLGNGTLTPLGAEMAGNADGSIPSWTGGATSQPPGNRLGDIPTQLFAPEKPLFQVNAGNVAQHASLLSEGTRALLAKYPDSFRLEVYPSHRTAAAPQAVYDNVAKNALRCSIREGWDTIKGCIGGIPFPIPRQGVEVMWNHLLRVEAPSIEYRFRNIVGSADGSHTLATRNEIAFQYPPYYQGARPEDWSGEYAMFRYLTIEPPFKSGESLVARDSINGKYPRQAWQYMVGQRRVRRAPTVSYDTPDFVSSGANYFDEVQGFFGALDRYEWKLIGKREMLIPYNTNALLGVSASEALDKHHLNPDHLRWERHRVWEVEATLAEGRRHAVPKRRYYIDEDTWSIALVDGYDKQGTLWRTTQTIPYVVPAIPATLLRTAVVFNLQADTMSVVQMLNEEDFKVVPPKPESYFTGAAVAAEGVR